MSLDVRTSGKIVLNTLKIKLTAVEIATRLSMVGDLALNAFNPRR